MRIRILALAAAVMASPFALASVPPIKDYCEDPAFDWWRHKYLGATTLNEKLFGTGPTGFVLVVDGNVTGDCNGDTVPADYDGHLETGIGGAILTYDLPLYPPGDPMYCPLESPHHSGTVHVEDRVFGFGVAFIVGVEDNCDGVIDYCAKCLSWCDPWAVTVGNVPGFSDGAYWIFVTAPAVKGTVTTGFFLEPQDPAGPPGFGTGGIFKIGARK